MPFAGLPQNIKSLWSRAVKGFLEEGHQEALPHSGSVPPEMYDCCTIHWTLLLFALNCLGHKIAQCTSGCSVLGYSCVHRILTNQIKVYVFVVV